MLKFLPEDYQPYLEYLPDLQICVNIFMTFTPLFSYGSTCYSIHKRQTSLGFSLDICCTMFMAAILRIYYYICSPYEPTLLRQSIVMIFIQALLLKISLKHRPPTYDPDLLSPLPVFENELNARLPRRLSSATLDHELYWRGDWVGSMELMSGDTARYVWGYAVTYVAQALRFFDVYYRRPFLFWQWKQERKYWAFVAGFVLVFGVLTGWLRDNETYANVIGVLGLFIESLLPLPQILLLNRLQLVKNFKVILLLSWLGGDCTKISYLLYGAQNILVIFLIAGLFQMSLDIYIAYQFLKFKYLDTNPRRKEVGFVEALERSEQLITDIVHDMMTPSSSEIEMDDFTEKLKESIGDRIRASRSRSGSVLV
ncbi:hypothetical protein Cantr_08270 [Candida viswanathii]|uniref:PQ-loop repeat-containing protein 1 n=1 Tax=Candida viswanathii TaxID=5486 RepID=A0A367Y4L8_9ASCO|nr:hypothetical protein Cantr_08270 [Candida viswanathii]